MSNRNSYDHRIETNPTDGQAYFERALFLFDTEEDLEQAKEDFIQSINLGYEEAEAYSNLALIYDMLEDNTAALECLNKALEFDPDHVVSWFALGTLYSIQGKTDEALWALGKVLEIELDFDEDDDYIEEDNSFAMEAFALRTRIYLEQNENALALAEARASKAFDPETNECELLEAVAALRLGKTDDVRSLLKGIQYGEEFSFEELKEHPLFCELKDFF
jgi:tetratricopeptide (TPR) repeat protein